MRNTFRRKRKEEYSLYIIYYLFRGKPLQATYNGGLIEKGPSEMVSKWTMCISLVHLCHP